MAVYTKISKRDVSSLVNDYQINEVKKFQGIKKGIEIYYNEREHRFSSSALRKQVSKSEANKKL